MTKRLYRSDDRVIAGVWIRRIYGIRPSSRSLRLRSAHPVDVLLRSPLLYRRVDHHAGKE